MTTGPGSRSRVAAAAVVGLLVFPCAGFAHDLWILPGKYRLSPGETTRVFVNDGDDFPESLTLLGKQRLTDVLFRGPDGNENRITEFRVDGKSLTFDIESKTAGTYVIALGTHARRARMKAEDFRDYLSEEKLDEITKMREARNENEQAAVERYAKWAKAVVDVGDNADEEEEKRGPWEEPVGEPFEIVPLHHPNRVEPGGELPIRVLFRGEPLPGVNVIGARASGRPREIETRTDERGDATVTVSAAGRWYLRALHMIRVEDDPEVQWESFWCTLSFEVVPRAAGPP